MQYHTMLKLLITLSLVACSFFASAEKITIYLSDSTFCTFEKTKGMLNGEYKSFYKNGHLRSEGSFLQNNRFGFWVFYKTDGSIHCVRDYKNNYSYEEKSSANILQKVIWNDGQNWSLIHHKDIIVQKRYLSTLLQSDNESLFAKEAIINKVLHAAFASIDLFESSRFVNKIDKSALLRKDIVGFTLKEDRILDQMTQCLQYRIIGIAPLVYSREQKKYSELGWIYYPELKTELGKISLNNPQVFANTLLDIFENRIFATETIPFTMPGVALSEAESESSDKSMISMIEKENSFIVSNFMLK